MNFQNNRNDDRFDEWTIPDVKRMRVGEKVLGIEAPEIVSRCQMDVISTETTAER